MAADIQYALRKPDRARRIRPFRFAVLASLASAVLLGGCRAGVSGSAAVPPIARAEAANGAELSPLRRLQAEFRPAYDAARDAVGTALSPVIFVRFSDMYLVEDGEVTAQAKGIPQKYHALHRTAHVPFVVFLKLRPYFGTSLPADVADDLAEYGELARAAVPDLGNYGFTEGEVAAQQTILNETAAYLDQLEAGEQVGQREFDAYRSSVHRPMMDLADAAGAAQVDALHAAMSQWRTLLTDDEWARLRVVIVGPRQPRNDYAATQYFAGLFPDRGNSLFPGESDRVFYVEILSFDRSDTSFAAERRVVSTLLLDGEASVAIFNNPARLSIDVMADGARRRLGEIDLGPLRSAPRPAE